jgi:NADPH:quinone reductase-like Zn-dependent oxidoreductase
MLAVTVTHERGHSELVLTEQPEPQAGDEQVVVAVRAVSLNNGELREALSASPGHRPGWEFAGVVEQAPTSSGLYAGDRVFGLASSTWAERVAVPLAFLVRMPEGLDFAVAAALPVAGMTAAGCLQKKPQTEVRRLLVTAATGGVGVLAIQLGKAQGAHVTALTRDVAAAEWLCELGADEVVTLDNAARAAPYDLILEGAGGMLLGRVMEWLAPRGLCVNFGDAAGDELTTFDARKFRLGGGPPFGGTSLYGFFLLEELMRPAPLHAPTILNLLAERAVTGALNPVLSRVTSWREADAVARALLNREFPGKAVLLID